MLIQRAVADSQTKLTQLKKAHSRLLEKFTDLELEYQSVKSQLAAMQGHGHGDTEGGGRSFFHDNDALEHYSDRPGSGGAMTAADSGYNTRTRTPRAAASTLPSTPIPTPTSAP